jgi:DUF1365 family protein
MKKQLGILALIPSRAAVEISERNSPNFHYSQRKEIELKNHFRLEPDEEEVFLGIQSRDDRGSREGIKTLLEAIYDRRARNPHTK